MGGRTAFFRIPSGRRGMSIVLPTSRFNVLSTGFAVAVACLGCAVPLHPDPSTPMLDRRVPSLKPHVEGDLTMVAKCSCSPYTSINVWVAHDQSMEGGVYGFDPYLCEDAEISIYRDGNLDRSGSMLQFSRSDATEVVIYVAGQTCEIPLPRGFWGVSIVVEVDQYLEHVIRDAFTKGQKRRLARFLRSR